MTSAPSQTQQQPGLRTPMTLISRNGNSLTVTGYVVAILSNGFQIEAGQGIGYFNIYTNSQTQFNGSKPFVGEDVEASGTGSPDSTMTALQVTQLYAVSGPIVATISGGFQMHGPPGVGYINIYTNGSTVYSGEPPFVGETVLVMGTGSLNSTLMAVTVAQQSGSPSPSASPSPTSSPSGPQVTISGPIDAMKTGGFQMQGPPGVGYTNVAVTSQTLIHGALPYVGEQVTVVATPAQYGWITAISVTQQGSGTPTPAPTGTPAPTPTPSANPNFTPPPTTGFMPSTWGKISPFQVFDETSNGYITESAAQSDGYRYSSVWGSRWNIGTSWNNSNNGLQDGYYDALETDASYTGWGAIGHDLAWWQQNYPSWILYACTSSGQPTNTPAYVPGLTTNIPLDVHNPQVVAYQIRELATYAHQIGYHALAIDEATFWQADEGIQGGYGCGIYQNGQWIQRYNGNMDPRWASDVVQWVQIAHQLLTQDPVLSTYHLKLIVNHPADQLTSNETTLLANTDAVLDETGYSDYGNYKTGSAADFTMTADWAKYAQQHGTAVLMNDNWGNTQLGTPQLDYSIATYLMGNEQAESLFASQGNGYGLEQFHSQYTTSIGAPCADYYSAGDPNNPSIYYRRFANAIVVVNAGSGANNEVANLPANHSYTDILGRAVSNPLTIDSNDGYVLLTSNGCQ